MNWKALIASALLLGSMLTAGASGPMTFKELSMLVRNGEEPQYILQDATRRKLVQRLSAEEEADLLSYGATPALVNALRAPALIASPEAVAAYNAQAQLERTRSAARENEERQAAMKAATPPPAATPAQEPANAEKKFELRFTAVDGSEVDFAKLRGKVVLVDFWATWCGPCVMEVPGVVAAYKKYHDKGFEVVGISLDKSKDDLLKFTRAQQMPWPQYFDGQGWKNAVSMNFNIHMIPTMWLVNKQGVLVNKEARSHLEADIEKLLNE